MIKKDAMRSKNRKSSHEEIVDSALFSIKS